jgi:hypothetical protein
MNRHIKLFVQTSTPTPKRARETYRTCNFHAKETSNDSFHLIQIPMNVVPVLRTCGAPLFIKGVWIDQQSESNSHPIIALHPTTVARTQWALFYPQKMKNEKGELDTCCESMSILDILTLKYLPLYGGHRVITLSFLQIIMLPLTHR